MITKTEFKKYKMRFMKKLQNHPRNFSVLKTKALSSKVVILFFLIANIVYISPTCNLCYYNKKYIYSPF